MCVTMKRGWCFPGVLVGLWEALLAFGPVAKGEPTESVITAALKQVTLDTVLLQLQKR